MLFKPFGSSLLASVQPEAIQPASGPAVGLSGGLWTNQAPPVQAVGPGPVRPGSVSGGPFATPHPDDPGPLENYPFGRPPLTPEQTRRAYARQLGIDPSQIDPNGMKLMLNEPGPGQASRTNNTATTTAPGTGGLLSSTGRASTPGGVVWGSQGGLLPGVAGVGPSYGVPGLSGGNWPGQGVSWLPTGSSGMPGGQAGNPWQATLAGMSPGGGAGFGVAPVDQNVYTGAAGLLGIPVGSQGDSTDWAAPQGAAPGHGLPGWAAATQHPGQPGQAGTLWGDAVPSPWDRQESPEERQEGGGADQEEEKPKEAPSPGGTILITTYGTYIGVNLGDHSALYIGSQRMLYDPGGSFRSNERGSGGVFDLGEGGLQAYIKYHEAGGSKVHLTKIPTTQGEEAEIVSRAEQAGGGSFMDCASKVSDALGGVCGIPGSISPGILHGQAERAKREE